MKITRDTDYRRHLLDSQRARMGIGSRRTGVHVSDLIMCLRKAWAERVSEHVEEISDNTVLTWLRGLSHEALLTDGVEQVRAGYCFTCQQSHTYSPQIADTNRCPVCNDTLMVGTIDWVTLEGEDGRPIEDFVPVEMKSTLKSSRKTLEDGEMLWFVDQIKTYMAIHGRARGRIAILHIMDDYSRGDPNIRSEGPKAELRVYGVEWDSADEMQQWLLEMQERKRWVEGDQMPPLNHNGVNERSPIHSFICDYCVIGQRLPDGSECDNFPWTRDGLRKGSKLAQQMTMDEIASELAAMSSSNSGGVSDEHLRDATPVSPHGPQVEASPQGPTGDDEAVPGGQAPSPTPPSRRAPAARIDRWYAKHLAADIASLATTQPAFVNAEIYRRDATARIDFATALADLTGYAMTFKDWAFILEVDNDGKMLGKNGDQHGTRSSSARASDIPGRDSDSYDPYESTERLRYLCEHVIPFSSSSLRRRQLRAVESTDE